MAGTYVEPHEPALGTVDPAAAAAATDAGMTAATERYGHYEANTHGQDATCGDPMPAESTLQSWPASGPEPSVPGKTTL